MTDPRSLAEHVDRRLRDLVLLLRRANAGQPITTQQMTVLSSLEAGPRRMSELAAEHGVRLPTMTRQIGRLLRDGLVARGRQAGDARVVTVELTPVGVERLLRARDRRIDHLTERLRALSPDERAAIEAALPALARLFTDS
jgi:DNA-binding MarR family transcriptional regulator